MLWERKKQEERDYLFRDVEELKQLNRQKMFGRPGHGAPTQDIRKKKFTEHQLKRSQSMHSLGVTDDEWRPEKRRHDVFTENMDPQVG